MFEPTHRTAARRAGRRRVAAVAALTALALPALSACEGAPETAASSPAPDSSASPVPAALAPEPGTAAAITAALEATLATDTLTATYGLDLPALGRRTLLNQMPPADRAMARKLLQGRDFSDEITIHTRDGNVGDLLATLVADIRDPDSPGFTHATLDALADVDLRMRPGGVENPLLDLILVDGVLHLATSTDLLTALAGGPVDRSEFAGTVLAGPAYTLLDGGYLSLDLTEADLDGVIQRLSPDPTSARAAGKQLRVAAEAFEVLTAAAADHAEIVEAGDGWLTVTLTSDQQFYDAVIALARSRGYGDLIDAVGQEPANLTTTVQVRIEDQLLTGARFDLTQLDLPLPFDGPASVWIELTPDADAPSAPLDPFDITDLFNLAQPRVDELADTDADLTST